MIFNWFRKKPTGQEQLQDFLNRLSASEPQDLGLAVATIEHTANTQFIYGDFYDPHELMRKRPDVLELGVMEAQRLQATGLEVLAVGWIVWVHTFRAVVNPDLAPMVRSMWALLIRGAPYAHSQRQTLMPIVGFELDVNEPNRIPIGFC